MKRFFPVLVLCLACVSGQVLAAPIFGLDDRERIPNRYIVVLKDGQQVASVANDMSTRHRGRNLRTYNRALAGFALEMEDADRDALAADPRVAYVEADRVLHVYATETPVTWGLDRIDQHALPLNNSYTYNTSAANVNVYIIDSGIRQSHVELAPRVHSAFTAINDGRGTDDCSGHGTHVSATVGGTTYGVAKGVNIYAVRVMDCTGSGTTSGVIAGVDWVTSNHVAPAVANMSLGGSASSALDSAVRKSIASGVTYAVAAGNSNADACAESPARIAEALTVGATTKTDARASFSNYGGCVDLFAPGSGITSAWNTSDTATNTISGTSMASPHVAGLAALYLANHPAATPAEVEAALKNAATAGVVSSAGTGSPNLLASNLFPVAATNVCPTGYDTYQGNLTFNGETQFQPNDNFYYSATPGVQSGVLTGPAGTDIDLYLYRWDGTYGWQIVAVSTSNTPDERIDYGGDASFYIWAVTSYTGFGPYTFCLQHPQ